jgi:hypothetical protein
MNKYNFKEFIGFGIAGNFAHHLEQAKESADFINVQVEEQNAPKGVFPFYLPNSKSFLGKYPISSSKLTHPKQNENLQMEPEVALICKIKYKDSIVIDLNICCFTAYNDATIRKQGAKKISEKKNWAEDTKGVSQNIIPIDKFENGGVMDSYHIASFIKRDGRLHMYGKDSPLVSYSYFYDKLKFWIIDKLNKQQDSNPLENLSMHLKACEYPKNMIISIGSTSYTDFGENNYLAIGDECYVFIYDSKHYSLLDIKNLALTDSRPDTKNISILHQIVVS